MTSKSFRQKNPAAAGTTNEPQLLNAGLRELLPIFPMAT